MSPLALEQLQLWTATFAEPAAVVVFGALLLARLRALQVELVGVVREELGKIEQALRAQTEHLKSCDLTCRIPL